ncbi:hypothetical protein ABK040_003563 [Willaertia magna]
MSSSSSTTSPSQQQSASFGGKENEDIFENILITLRTLQLQNKRIMEFQQASYKWHLQHHENIKKIITGLNLIGESFERMGIEGYQLTIQEDNDLKRKSREAIDEHSNNNPSSLGSNNSSLILGSSNKHNSQPSSRASSSSSSPTNSLIGSSNNNNTIHSSLNLHALVINYFNASSRSEGERIQFERQLQTVSDLETFATLRESSFEMLVPTIASWFKSLSTFKYGFIYMNEGLRSFGRVFDSPKTKKYVNNCIDALESLHEEDLAQLEGVSLKEIRELYDVLVKAVLLE